MKKIIISILLLMPLISFSGNIDNACIEFVDICWIGGECRRNPDISGCRCLFGDRIQNEKKYSECRHVLFCDHPEDQENLFCQLCALTIFAPPDQIQPLGLPPITKDGFWDDCNIGGSSYCQAFPSEKYCL